MISKEKIEEVYKKFHGRVDDDILHIAIVKLMTEYNPDMGLSYEKYVANQVYFAKKTKVLYEARESKKRVYLDDDDNIENMYFEDTTEEIHEKIDMEAMHQIVKDDAIFKQAVECEKIDEKVVEYLKEKYNRGKKKEKKTKICDLPLFE